MSAGAALANAPTAERLARGRLVECSAIGTEAGPAQAGSRMFRALPTIERLARDGSLSGRQRDAADRYRDDYELAMGAHDGSGAGSARYGWYYPDAQLAALECTAKASAALGPRVLAVVQPIVLGYPGGGDITLADLARNTGRNRQELAGVLKLGLDVLADHYELP